ncbi:MAG TPA: hypothetical protein VFD58_24960 [Blastocatellia bacterium]|nr:hypothetical protein [Blastocatellia bacterium]
MSPKSLSQLLLITCLTFATGLAPAQAQTPPAVETAQVKPKLSPGAEEVAKIIGVMPLVERLSQIPRGAGGAMTPEELGLRQQITEAVLTASLEVDGVIAEIDSETDHITNVRTQLEARRDRALAISNIASIIGGGVTGVAGTALQFSDNTAKTGNVIGVVGGAFSTVLSFVGLRVQRGGKLSLGTSPNMLARFFNRKAEFHSEYPEEIWAYLDHVPPGESGTETRRALLIKEWTDVGRLESKASPKADQKIDSLTSSASQQRRLTIDLLTDRAAMLADVRARVSLMKRDLSKLMLAIRSR